MNVFGLLLSLLAVLVSIIIVYYQYYYRLKVTKDSRILSALRFISILCILLILINPKFESKSVEILKPKLFVLSDNSSSISYNQDGDTLRMLSQSFEGDPELQQRFDVSFFSFAEVLSSDTAFTFTKEQTNIYKAIQDVNALGTDQQAAIVLLTDGKQTYGNSYAYMNSRNPIYPIVIGDTILRPDIEINRINVNAYATLDNNFPVEVFLTSSVDKNLDSKFSIIKDGITLYSSPVSFSEGKKSERLSFYLPADTVGMQLYEARLATFRGEENTRNNVQRFGVEILDEQAKVAIVYGFLHPDLGMIKRSIESNRQRKAELISIEELKETDREYSMYVLYQPTRRFTALFNELKANEQNLFIITGNQTDWSFLNERQLGFSAENSGLSENIFPIFQNDFNTFYVEDIDFDTFPPLYGSLAPVNFTLDHGLLLSRRIDEVKTGEPLLATFTNGETKNILLLGENIWKWRSHSFTLYESFEKFDQFFNSLIQFLQLSDRKKDMDLFYKPVYQAKEAIKIQAKNYDSNLRIELNSKLVLSLKDGSKELPFYLAGNAYEVELENLKEGKYSFEVKDLSSDKKKAGSFMVVPFSIEQDNSGPNVADLDHLARNSQGQLFYQDQFENLKSELIDNSQFRATEKQRTNLISLIDWKWLLGLIVLSLSMEWLLRKYRGLI